jgi:hypothetical protein
LQSFSQASVSAFNDARAVVEAARGQVAESFAALYASHFDNSTPDIRQETGQEMKNEK